MPRLIEWRDEDQRLQTVWAAVVVMGCLVALTLMWGLRS